MTFFNHSFVDGHLGYFHIITIVNNSAVNIREYRYLFEILTPILLDKYPEMGLLDHIVVLFLIF